MLPSLAKYRKLCSYGDELPIWPKTIIGNPNLSKNLVLDGVSKEASPTTLNHKPETQTSDSYCFPTTITPCIFIWRAIFVTPPQSARRKVKGDRFLKLGTDFFTDLLDLPEGLTGHVSLGFHNGEGIKRLYRIINFTNYNIRATLLPPFNANDSFPTCL